MKHSKDPAGGWQSRLHAWCNHLSHRQRQRFILIIFVIYFLMAIGVFLWIYLDESKNIQIRHIENPIPGIKKRIQSFTLTDRDTVSTDKKQKTYGKEGKE